MTPPTNGLSTVSFYEPTQTEQPQKPPINGGQHMSFIDVCGIGRITRILTYRGPDGEPTPYRYSESGAVYILAYAAFQEPSTAWATYKLEFWIMDSSGSFTTLGRNILSPDTFEPRLPRLLKKQWVYIRGNLVHSRAGDYLSIRVQALRLLGGLPHPTDSTPIQEFTPDIQPLTCLTELPQPGIPDDEIAESDSAALDDLFT